MQPGADVRIAPLDDLASLRRALDLVRDIWAYAPDDTPFNTDLLRAMAHAGNYVVGAFDADDALVGVCIAFLGLHDGRLHLHSHMLGVAPAAQGRNVGFALKQHQRLWAQERGIEAVTWTFDPLVRRNAAFNLVKLGAAIVDYYPAFYGTMSDGVNAGDESDRCLAWWDVAEDGAPVATPADEAPSGVVVLEPDADGNPRTTSASEGADTLSAWVPPDIVALRGTSPAAARAWRLALRATFGHALQHGYTAETITRGGWYILRRDA